MNNIPGWMVVKLYRGGQRVAEFINAKTTLDAYLFMLREIGCDYEVYVYVPRDNAYVFTGSWSE